MDYDQLFERPPLATHPLSVLLFVPPVGANDAPSPNSSPLTSGEEAATLLAKALPRVVALLTAARAVQEIPRAAQADEVIFVLPPVSTVPQAWQGLRRLHGALGVPKRRAGVTFRVLTRPDPSSPAAWQEAFAACRHAIVLTLDLAVTLDPLTLARMLAHLDYADVVVPRRTRGWRDWWRWPAPLALAWRWLLGIGARDPACPIQLYRRPAMAAIPLQLRGPARPVELLAKLNFMTFLLDEVPLAWPEPIPPVGHLFRGQWGAWRRLLWRPLFWDYASQGRRIPLHEVPLPPVALGGDVKKTRLPRLRPRARKRWRLCMARPAAIRRVPLGKNHLR